MNELTNELMHHGVQGMHWGIRRYQNKDGTLTEVGKKKAMYNRRTREAIKTNDDANEIVDTLNEQDRHFLDAPPKGKGKWIEKEDEKQISPALLKRFVLYEAKDTLNVPVAFLEIWERKKYFGENAGGIAIAVRSGMDYRGKGYASKLIEQGKEWFEKYGSKSIDYLHYSALKENVISNELAKNHGFEKVKEIDDENIYRYSKKQR